MSSWTYSKSGVNINKKDSGVEKIAEHLKKTFNYPRFKTLYDIGHFANLVDLENNKALAITTDGVGTKLLIAQKLEKYDTVGIDCVAMNVNDCICVGAEPFAMVDYIAVKKINEKILSELGKGLAKGAELAGIAIIGGETAVLPDMLSGEGDKAFDLAGTCVGIVEKKKIITGNKIHAGDILIGLESSGIHSNGLTLARKVLDMNSRKTLNELLTPTKIYSKPIMKLLKEVSVLGLANITGSGLLNLLRFSPKIGFEITEWPKVQKLFDKIQKAGNISDFEMYKTFNMGIGFCVVVPESETDKTLGVLKEEKAKIIGYAINENKVVKGNLIYK